MKTAVVLLALAITGAAVYPEAARAVVPLYDNFEARTLDEEKWFGSEAASPGVDVLESARLPKSERTLRSRALNIVSRTFSSADSASGSSAASNKLILDDGSGIRTIQATVLVKKAQVTACGTNDFASEPRVRIGGMYFNAGTPVADDSTDDVLAFIAAGRPLDSPEPPGVLSVYAVVTRCTNSACSASAQVGRVELGTIALNRPVKLRITWEADQDRFVFQKGRAAAVGIPYVLSDANPPGTAHGGNKRLEVQHLLADCTSAPRPMASTDAFFDDVRVE